MQDIPEHLKKTTIVNEWYDPGTNCVASVKSIFIEDSPGIRGGWEFRVSVNHRPGLLFFASCLESFLPVVGDACASAKILFDREVRNYSEHKNRVSEREHQETERRWRW